MATRIYPKSSTRVPPAVNGIQTNFCKNPACGNFGMPALESIKGMRLRTIAGTSIRTRDGYKSSTTGRGLPALKCVYCDTRPPPLKSNLAIHEELTRMEAYLKVEHSVNDACKTVGCANKGVSWAATPDRYRSIGKTKAGSPRYTCKACSKSFSVKLTAILQQRKSHKNTTIFRCLVNKVPLNRICEIVNISISSLYDKIDFIHKQCLLFAAEHEKMLPTMEFPELNISSDRQDYIVNWSATGEKRNVVLKAMGSADNKTGYVFGMHVNWVFR